MYCHIANEILLLFCSQEKIFIKSITFLYETYDLIKYSISSLDLSRISLSLGIFNFINKNFTLSDKKKIKG
jgi:hypothetical protein